MSGLCFYDGQKPGNREAESMSGRRSRHREWERMRRLAGLIDKYRGQAVLADARKKELERRRKDRKYGDGDE